MATNEQRKEAFNRGRHFGQGGQSRVVTQAMLDAALGAFQTDPEVRAAFESGFHVALHGTHGTGAELPPEEASRRGWGAGEQAALGKQARIPGNWYGQLGPDQGDASQRQRFDQGFYGGYDKAAAGLGTVGPGGKTATSVLKTVTTTEEKKLDDPYGARQTMLAAHYGDLDNQINAELSSYGSADGGLAFLADWKLAKAEFTARNTRQMTDEELTDSERKLEEMRGRRTALIAATATKFAIPGVTSLFKPPVTPTQQPPPKPGAVAAPVKAGLFGMSRNATIGLALVALTAVGGGIYYATKDDEHEGMEKGPDGVWRPKPRLAMLPPAPGAARAAR